MKAGKACTCLISATSRTYAVWKFGTGGLASAPGVFARVSTAAEYDIISAEGGLEPQASRASYDNIRPLMCLARYILAAALMAAVVAVAQGDKAGGDATGPAALGERAAEKLRRGDKAGACADARAALAQNPDDDAAFATARLACESANLPSQDKYKTKLKPKPAPREPAQPQDAMPGSAREAAPAARAPASGAARPTQPQWYEGGPTFEEGVVIPEKPAPVDGKLESSSRLTAAAWERLESGDAMEAVRLATEAIEINGRNPRAFLLRAMALRSKRQCRAALADAEAGLELLPNDLTLLKLKADVLNCAKDYKAAAEAAEKALTIDPMDARGHAIKAWALRGMGDAQGMEAELKKASALNPAYESSLASVETLKDDPEVFFLYPGERPPAKKAGKGEGGWPGRNTRLALAGGCALLVLVGLMTGLSQWLRS